MLVKKLVNNSDGQVLVLFALALTVLVGFTALVVDVGRINVRQASMQSAVDAAALAAVQELPENTVAATTKAEEFFEENGFKKEQITKVEFLNSDRKIRVTASTPLEYTFAKIFNKGNSTTVTKKAAAALTTPFSDLDYAIFSGDELELLHFTGGSTTINGDVHSNQNIKGHATINGEATAVGVFENPEPDATVKTDNSPVLNMPELSADELAELKQSAISSGTFYAGNVSFSPDQLNAIFATGAVIYVEGNVTTNGSGVCASAGSIIATGNITFNGSDVTLTQTSPICFYTSGVGSTVTLNGSGCDLYGAVWAPKGTVAFNGQGQKITGKVYGDKVTFAGAVTVNYSNDDAIDFPIKTFRLVE
ncbi:MAG: pilus assembly protein TadG-related protein [Desulfotomaculaceae bacterium]|nr:pilus assembly protein TadG-related protein [Desulfotomaculaceae bacterium]